MKKLVSAKKKYNHNRNDLTKNKKNDQSWTVSVRPEVSLWHKYFSYGKKIALKKLHLKVCIYFCRLQHFYKAYLILFLNIKDICNFCNKKNFLSVFLFFVVVFIRYNKITPHQKTNKYKCLNCNYQF